MGEGGACASDPHRRRTCRGLKRHVHLQDVPKLGKELAHVELGRLVRHRADVDASPHSRGSGSVGDNGERLAGRGERRRHASTPQAAGSHSLRQLSLFCTDNALKYADCRRFLVFGHPGKREERGDLLLQGRNVRLKVDNAGRAAGSRVASPSAASRRIEASLARLHGIGSGCHGSCGVVSLGIASPLSSLGIHVAPVITLQ